ncbi:MAG: hypothetical protein PHQ75_15315, partial [Thermoguttaceae bacterium]|nr:hypothetical protein [Thermoguttaceae bacterium]
TSTTRIQQDRTLFARLDKLEAVGDFELLLQLKETGYFNHSFVPLTSDQKGARGETPQELPLQASDTVPKAQIQHTPETTQIGQTGQTESESERELGRQAARFFRMPGSKQKSLRALNEKIEQSPNAKELLIVLDHYYFWYRYRLHEMERDLIGTTPSSSRIARIKSLYLRRQQLWASDMGHSFPFLQGKKPAFGPETGQAGVPSPPLSDDTKEDPRTRENRRIKNMLPKELQREDLAPLRKMFYEFCREQFENRNQIGKNEKPQADSVQNRPATENRYGRGNQSLWQGRGEGMNKFRRGDRGFRLVHEFLTQHPSEELIALFSAQGQKYLRSLSEKEQKATFGFILSFYMPWGNNNVPGRERRKNESFPGNDQAVFSQTAGRGVTGWTPNESTKELAQTLQRLPQEVRDELLSLPSDEMYARLLAIHWGFDSQKSGLAGEPADGPNRPVRPEFTPGNGNGLPRFFEGDRPTYGPKQQNRTDKSQKNSKADKTKSVSSDK